MEYFRLNKKNNILYFMNNKPRVKEFKIRKKLSKLQIEISNNLDKFNKQCEDDFRKIISSFLNFLKISRTFGYFT